MHTRKYSLIAGGMLIDQHTKEAAARDAAITASRIFGVGVDVYMQAPTRKEILFTAQPNGSVEYYNVEVESWIRK